MGGETVETSACVEQGKDCEEEERQEVGEEEGGIVVAPVAGVGRGGQSGDGRVKMAGPGVGRAGEEADVEETAGGGGLLVEVLRGVFVEAEAAAAPGEAALSGPEGAVVEGDAAVEGADDPGGATVGGLGEVFFDEPASDEQDEGGEEEQEGCGGGEGEEFVFHAAVSLRLMDRLKSQVSNVRV